MPKLEIGEDIAENLVCLKDMGGNDEKRAQGKRAQR